MMKSVLALAAAAMLLTPAVTHAAEEPAKSAEAGPPEALRPPHQQWAFEGVFGTFDRAALQRGFQVYKEVCSACHSLNRIAFHNLSEPGGPSFTDVQMKAIAAE